MLIQDHKLNKLFALYKEYIIPIIDRDWMSA